MRFFKRTSASTQSTKTCPRCLGKGNVDMDDITRLDKELVWAPGPCAYCDGVGTINPKTEENVAVDATYLVSDISKEERKRIINGNPDAIERGILREQRLERSIEQITYLHFEGGLSATQIATFYTIGTERSGNYETRKKELVNYVERLIQKKINNH